MALFEVCAKCGHVGRGKYVDKIFAVVAVDAKTAAKIARNIPRVKHHHKDAIRYVIEIDQERYMEIRWMNMADPYMNCSSKREQKELCGDYIDHIAIRDDHRSDAVKEDNTGRQLYDGKKAIRNPRKYYRKYDREERIVA